jgi:hypothetical protein
VSAGQQAHGSASGGRGCRNRYRVVGDEVRAHDRSQRLVDLGGREPDHGGDQVAAGARSAAGGWRHLPAVGDLRARPASGSQAVLRGVAPGACETA